MQDSAQKLPSFRCFLPVELDDRASWHETRHRKRKNCLLLSLQKVSVLTAMLECCRMAFCCGTLTEKEASLALDFLHSRLPLRKREFIECSQGKTNWFEDCNYIGSNRHNRNAFDTVMECWKRCVNREHGVLALKFASSASWVCFAPKFWSVCPRLVDQNLFFMILGKVTNTLAELELKV